MTAFKWLLVNIVGTMLLAAVSIYFQATEHTVLAIIIFLVALSFYTITHRKMVFQKAEES